MGGSITAGQGSVDSPNWPRYLFDWLGDAYGADKVQGESSPHKDVGFKFVCLIYLIALPGIDSIFFSPCINQPPFTRQQWGRARHRQRLHVGVSHDACAPGRGPCARRVQVLGRMAGMRRGQRAGVHAWQGR